MPAVLVCADEVTHGVTNAEDHFTATARLWGASVVCLFAEDTSAALAATHASGRRTVAAATTHRPAAHSNAEPIAPALGKR